MKNRKLSNVLLACALLVLGVMLAHAEEHAKKIEVGFQSPLFLKQGKVKVTHADIDAFMATIPQQDRSGFLTSPERIGKLLTNLTLVEAMVQEAQEAGHLEDSGTQARLYRALSDEISKIFREKFLESTALDDYTERAREIYLSEPDRFMGRQTLDFYHVLVTVGENRNEVEAMRRVAEAWERYRENDMSLEQLAEEYSDDPSYEQNAGLIEGVEKDALTQPVRATLARMSENSSVSEPVRSEFGWHLVKLVARNDPEQLPWEESRERALEIARDEHLTQAIERKLRSYQSETPEFQPGAVEALLERYNSTFERDIPSNAVEQSMTFPDED